MQIHSKTVIIFIVVGAVIIGVTVPVILGFLQSVVPAGQVEFFLAALFQRVQQFWPLLVTCISAAVVYTVWRMLRAGSENAR